ncbi:hypothetical protein TraAM80_04756 [Trypanosoma rangeli]|uniref:Uncharacterized protein n=1 Tax=Trypanosoma rangeli TaxID=5698 RepID=A0A422NI76_TRYRA|nr:uncharacterized protein TraAM80_04756 [Trypanosoma rangeli]RNF05183.1 hypothetical protein TraAM80_04756 [Trypanosoma rangeli]|eukprot:RNF05183.1 hypothetical protein TraAM80_04756 [Trypanosoma rangeli]
MHTPTLPTHFKTALQACAGAGEAQQSRGNDRGTGSPVGSDAEDEFGQFFEALAAPDVVTRTQAASVTVAAISRDSTSAGTGASCANFPGAVAAVHGVRFSTPASPLSTTSSVRGLEGSSALPPGVANNAATPLHRAAGAPWAASSWSERAGRKTSPATCFNGHAPTLPGHTGGCDKATVSTRVPSMHAGDAASAPTATSLSPKNKRKHDAQHNHKCDGELPLTETIALVSYSSPTINTPESCCMTLAEGKLSPPERGATMLLPLLEINGAAEEHSVVSCTGSSIHGSMASDSVPKLLPTATSMRPPHNDGVWENVTPLLRPRLNCASSETEEDGSGVCATHGQVEVDDDDDEFGEFVEVAPRPGMEPVATPEVMPEGGQPLAHAIDGPEREPVHEVAANGETGNEQDHENDIDEEEGEWAAFTGAVASPSLQLQQVTSAAGAAGVRDVDAAEEPCSQDSEGKFIFHRDMDIARMVRWLRELTGCVLDGEESRDPSRWGATEQPQRGAVSSHCGELREGQSRSELLYSVMESLPFTGLGLPNVAGDTSPGPDCSVVLGGSFVSHNLPVWMPFLGEGREADIETSQQLHQTAATLSLVDFVTTARISDRHIFHRHEQLESVLLQASQLQLKGIPLSEAIAKVRDVATEYQRQQQKQEEKEKQHAHVINGPVWEIHPMLPVPCIGGSLFPASSLRLPL